MADQQKVRVRFAPSPTGYLHIGGLRTALFNYLFARNNNGVFTLRIEDTDLERSEQKYQDAILESLAWVAIQPDEPVVIQSARIARHQEVIAALVAQGKAYRCYCLPEEIAQRYGATHDGDLFVKYDGYCRGRTDGDNKPFGIRFAIPEGVETISFNDMVRGPLSFELDQIDDFIIARSDGTPIYNFVVVVDDHDMGITHVIRGEDHISNTFKQILLYQACGYQLPEFAHIPLILGPSGDRLSKRDGAVSVGEYKKDGFLPDALVNYLARLGWAHKDQEIFTREELIAFFSLKHVGKKGAIFDPQKLAWVNSVYIKNADPLELWTMMVQDVAPELEKEVSWNSAQKKSAVALYQERVSTLRQLADCLAVVNKGPQEYAQDALTKWITPDTGNHLELILGILERSDDVSGLAHAIKQLSVDLNSKLVVLAQPLRIALIGTDSGPGVFDLIALIDRSEVIRRIELLRTVVKQR